MSEYFAQITRSSSLLYLVRQLSVILFIFFVGIIICLACSIAKERVNRSSLLESALVAFPVGLATFAIAAYVMLIIGLPYNSITVASLYLIIALIFVYIMIKRKVTGLFDWENRLTMLILAGAVIVLGLFACSGIMPISISNDSMYYFHEYPKDIVYFGCLRDQFDAFLTDTGLAAVSIETLPFLFGYNEGFGVREFMHINFIIFFSFESLRVLKGVLTEKKAVILAIIMGLILATSSPVWLLGHWAMANMYFMEFFFMGAVCMAHHVDGHEYQIFVPSVLCVAASLVRIEGGIFVLLLTLCISLLNIKGKSLVCWVIFPVFILTFSYTAKIFLFYKFDNIYIFMNPTKALLQSAALIAVAIYVVVIKKHLPTKLLDFMPYLMLIGFVFVNAVLFVYNRELYIANMHAFYLNLTRQSGWGMLPVLSVGAGFIIIVMNLWQKLTRGKNRESFEDRLNKKYYLVITLGFVLVTMAVSFMRGDPLAEQVGDSGNRVLLQVAPLIIYTLLLYFVDLYERIREE